MRYKPKGVAALQMILGGFPDTMRVEIDDNIGVSAKTVGELRKLTAWSGNLAVTTPDAVYPRAQLKWLRPVVQNASRQNHSAWAAR